MPHRRGVIPIHWADPTARTTMQPDLLVTILFKLRLTIFRLAHRQDN
jgi:hypothetical protein